MKMKLGEFVKEERDRRGLSQRELGKLAGLTGSFISRIESGQYKGSSPETLTSLATALKIKPSVLYDFLYPAKNATPSITKTPDEIVKELNASLPACIPVYEGIDSKKIVTYSYVPKVLIGGSRVQGVIAKTDFEDDIKKGDILICSHTLVAYDDDLIIYLDGEKEIIKRHSGKPSNNCYVIVQSVRMFRSEVGT